MRTTEQTTTESYLNIRIDTLELNQQHNITKNVCNFYNGKIVLHNGKCSFPNMCNHELACNKIKSLSPQLPPPTEIRSHPKGKRNQNTLQIKSTSENGKIN